VGRAEKGIDFDYFSTLVGRGRAAKLVHRSGLISSGAALPQQLDLPTFWRLCAENIQARDDESHGIAAVPVPRGSLSVLFTAAKEADSLVEALERFSAAARLIRKECQITVGRSRDAIRLTVRPVDRMSLRAEIYVECFLVVTHCALRWMTGRRLDPVLVRGSAMLRGRQGTLLSSFKSAVIRRGHGATIVYRRDDIDAPILAKKYKTWGDREFESFMGLIQEHDLGEPKESHATDGAVRKALRTGLRTQRNVAQALNCSPATLRRHLANEGLSFRQLSAETRRDELQHLLATDMGSHDIATKLGFSDDRSLRRFCRESLGMSPRQYRQLLRGSAPRTLQP
jgi:AraC-like DNA-binding protein